MAAGDTSQSLHARGRAFLAASAGDAVQLFTKASRSAFSTSAFTVSMPCP